MIIKKIKESQILDFCSIGNNIEAAVKLKERVLKALDEGRTQLDWFYILERDGEEIGRVAFDTYPSEPNSVMVWLLYVSEGKGNINNGAYLLRSAIKDLGSMGIKLINNHLYGNDDEKLNEKKEMHLLSGFELMQRKKSYIFSDGKLPCIDKKLNFKCIEELDEQSYIDAIMKVTEATLDSYDEMEVREKGQKLAAEGSFKLLKEIDFNTKWWKLAYEEDGSFVGLILPQRFNDEYGAINYIGVIPEKRGKGYVIELLEEGTSVLKAAGIKKIIADIDVKNFPMENALIKSGYEFNEQELVLEYRL